MPTARRLLDKEITYSSAKDNDANTLHQISDHGQQTHFLRRLEEKRDHIKDIVTHHLGLSSPSECHVAEAENWLHGSFKVSIPVTICPDGGLHKRVLLQVPLPYRVGESVQPGNCDEKIRCEAGTYAWIQENSPDVPIPHLYGFALSTGQQFTRLEHLPTPTQWYHLLHNQALSWLGHSVPSPYVRHQQKEGSTEIVLGTGYLIVEYIEESRGEMLSKTWENGRHESRRRANVFRDLSRILLSLTRIALPKIGSFIIDDDGFLRLANRPLSIEIQQLECENIPTDIPRDCTYSNVDLYIGDMLSAHDNRFRYQPNANNDAGDCASQLSALSAMRTISRSFFQRDLRNGPFFLSFTNLNQSNIFVDAEWHITCLVDLEWVCSLPVEMIRPPHWLSNNAVDSLDATAYDTVRKVFMRALEIEERAHPTAIRGKDGIIDLQLSTTMERSWLTGTFWYTLALSSPSGLFGIFNDHIRPLFVTENTKEFHSIMPLLWRKGVGDTVDCEVSDKQE
ncbi:hypothetical protein BO71DRAFT_439965, partial [Aspergillus ellipticus CBS 707.79]